jgi:HK97 family phage major capsid protein
MNKNARELKAVQLELQNISTEVKSLKDDAEKADRTLSDEDMVKVDELFAKKATLDEQKSAIEDRISVENDINELGKNIAVKEDEADRAAQAQATKSIGEQFVESKAYKLAAMDEGSAALKSISGVKIKATLKESEGGAGLLVPQYQPGVLPKLFQRLTIADLLASGSTTSPTITYMKESVANLSAISTVAEGGLKPEVELAYEQASAQVKKIAGLLPVTDEMLEDAQALSSYINGRLTLGVKIKEEQQLLNGAASGSELSGILHNVPAENKELHATALKKQNAADNVFAAMTKVRSFFIEPDGIVMNPEDWAVLRLAKDEQGNYIGGSPFSNTGSNPGDSLFGLPVVVTTAISAGTALVGAFQSAAQIFRRSGLTVETTNSHGENFAHNITAIRAEERLALAIYRPEGFATVKVTATS